MQNNRYRRAEFALADLAASMGFDLEIARLMIGERPDLRALGRRDQGITIYTRREAVRIAAAAKRRP
jgi:hypothetical protein